MSSIGIIATIGPVSANAATLELLSRAGMTVARLNGSHGTLDWHRGIIALIRATLPDLPILLDIPGRKIRTIQLAYEPSFEAGDSLLLTTDLSHDGSIKVPVNFDGLHQQLFAGINLFADDGTLSFTVERIEGRDIHVRANGGGTLKSRKGINVPEVSLGRDLVTDHDRAMIAFAKDNGVDYVGISFVESAAHIDAIREIIGGASPRVVAKVENQGGLDHLDEIAAATDVIMIDRGDLSVETQIDKVSVFQKRIINVARGYGKPVIVATELLHTMIDNPFPTKAEISDITNAVIDGAGLLMLSGETAVGKFPTEAVARLHSIAAVAKAHVSASASIPLPSNEIANAVKALSLSLPVTKIVVLSRSGYAAALVASASIAQPIIAVHPEPSIARSLNLVPGVRGVHVSGLSWQGTGAPVEVLRNLRQRDLVNTDDIVLVVGVNTGDERAYLNIFQTFRISALDPVPGVPPFQDGWLATA
jgi:pyruvate kinase